MNKCTVDIGNNIRVARKAKKLSQEYLANLLCTERTAISKWENGVNMLPLDQFVDICSALSVTPNEILGYEKKKDCILIENIIKEELNGINYKFYENEKEAIDGFKLMLAKEREINADCTLNDNDKRMWYCNNDFCFIVYTDDMAIYAVRTYSGVIDTEKFIVRTNIIPISYTWIEITFETDKMEYKGITTDEYDNKAVKDSVIEAVNDVIIDVNNFKKIQECNPNKICIYLLGHMYGNNFIGYSPHTQDYHRVSGFKIFKPDIFTVYERIIHDGVYSEKQLQQEDIIIYMPNESVIKSASLSITILNVKHCTEWDNRDYYDAEQEYHLSRFEESVLRYMDNINMTCNCNAFTSILLNKVKILINRLYSKDPYIINENLITKELESFNERYDRAFRMMVELHAPGVIVAQEIRMLNEKVNQLNKAIKKSDSYAEAKVRWNNKRPRSDELTAEEMLLEIIFGDGKLNDDSVAFRPRRVSKEQLKRAINSYDKMIEDKNGSLNYKYNIINEFYKYVFDTILFDLSQREKGIDSQNLLWILESMYEKYKDLENVDLKNILIYIVPAICIKSVSTLVMREDLLDVYKMYNEFKGIVDEFERG